MDSERSTPSEIRDKIEALRRVPSYRKDFTAWRKFVRQHEVLLRRLERVVNHQRKVKLHGQLDKLLKSKDDLVEAMRRKWKVRPPFPPPPPIPLEQWERPRFMSPLDELSAIEVVPPTAASKQVLLQNLVKGYDPIRVEHDYQSFKNGAGKTKYRGGKHLCMMVDLTKTEENLLEEMKDYLKHYQKMLPPRRTRRKPTKTVNIWFVYDQFKRGVAIPDIAEQLTKDDPSVSNPYRATYSAVDRAIKKADRLIAACHQASVS